MFHYCFEVTMKFEVEVVTAAAKVEAEVEIRPMGDVVEQDGDA